MAIPPLFENKGVLAIYFMNNNDWKRLRGIFKRASKQQLLMILKEVEIILSPEKSN